MRNLILGLLWCLGGCATAAPVKQAIATPRIVIEAAPVGQWTVAYHLPAPARQLVFQRSPDSSRGASWRAPADFEIVSAPSGEIVRRKDGARFARVALRLSPLYRELPKDYAPFSPFGDGGILFHSGRFFACADACGPEPKWRMRLAAPKGTAILVNGQRKTEQAEWVDRDSGRNIYLGRSRPVETPELLAVVDEALPRGMRDQLVRQLPLFMRHFSKRLGTLPAKPMLFASYDVAHRPGYGRQGGTLPGQVFVHFYGSIWPERMAKADLADELAWFFAHEAAHLYQRQLSGPEREDSWIHEGGADAFAALALREIAPNAAAALQERIDGAAADCTKLRNGRSVRTALAAGTFDAAYKCGLLLSLYIDSRIKAAAPASQGLYTVWNDYMARIGRGGTAGESQFLASVAAIGGDDLARRVRAAVTADGALPIEP